MTALEAPYDSILDARGHAISSTQLGDAAKDGAHASFICRLPRHSLALKIPSGSSNSNLRVVLRTAIVAISFAGLTGCLADPYIRSSPPPADRTANCNTTIGSIESADAYRYAYCVRGRMESKASGYAILNSGGSAFLLNLAGLAAYRAFRGENEANVAALSTGGASLYATQQYLYRKPREAIYFTGASAIDCAIGITRLRDAIDTATIDHNRNLSNTALNQAEVAYDIANGLRARIPFATCPSDIRKAWTQLDAAWLLSDPRSDMRAFRTRNTNARTQADRLKQGQTGAGIALLNATDAIRGTVNRQLAALQPNPSEIASALSVLKLSKPASTPTGETATEAKISAFEVPEDKARYKNASGINKSSSCNLSAPDVLAYKDAVERLNDSITQAAHELDAEESNLSAEERGASIQSADDSYKACSVAKPPSLLVFNVRPAQQPEKVVQGSSVSIPIEGGQAPFTVAPAASPPKGALTSEAKADDDGGYRIVVNASADTTPGRYTIVAVDNYGTSRLFVVEVTAKPAS